MNSFVRDLPSEMEMEEILELVSPEQPQRAVEDVPQPYKTFWNEDSLNNPQHGIRERANTPVSSSLRTWRPEFIPGSNIQQKKEIQLKIGHPQTLRLGLGENEKFSGTIRLYMKRTVYATDPFTGEGSNTYGEDIDPIRLNWPFRAHGIDENAVLYTYTGSDFYIDVTLNNEDKIFLKFVKLSTFVTVDEKRRGMNSKGKVMSLVLESLQDPEDRIEIPIQVVSEPRLAPEERKQPKNNRRRAIKTETTAAIQDEEEEASAAKVFKTEVIPNTAEEQKEQKIQMIINRLRAGPSQWTDAIAYNVSLFQAPSLEGNFN